MIISHYTGPGDFRPIKGRAVQAGGCGSLEGLTKGLAVDLAPVRVNLVSPGAVRLLSLHDLANIVHYSFLKLCLDRNRGNSCLPLFYLIPVFANLNTVAYRYGISSHQS